MFGCFMSADSKERTQYVQDTQNTHFTSKTYRRNVVVPAQDRVVVPAQDHLDDALSKLLAMKKYDEKFVAAFDAYMAEGWEQLRLANANAFAKRPVGAKTLRRIR